MALRVCACIACSAHPGSCPELVPRGRCTDCAREQDRARGTRQQRGYDAAHMRLRARWKPKVDRGQVNCARCGLLILPGTQWALDHSDDRASYLGPSHKQCNDSAGGKASHH